MTQNSDSEVISLLKDLQKRMTYLEKKIDLLSGTSAGRTSKSQNHSSSYQTGGSRRYKSKHETSFGSKSAGPSKWYDKKRGGENQGAPRNKKKTYEPSGKKRSKE